MFGTFSIASSRLPRPPACLGTSDPAGNRPTTKRSRGEERRGHESRDWVDATGGGARHRGRGGAWGGDVTSRAVRDRLRGPAACWSREGVVPVGRDPGGAGPAGERTIGGEGRRGGAEGRRGWAGGDAGG